MIFTRTIENFTCGHCGNSVRGGGYTNHCPKCLRSKHVDVHPGDRAERCGGMMEPIRLEGSSPEYIIIHRCVKCGRERPNKAVPEDDREALVAVAKSTDSGNNYT